MACHKRRKKDPTNNHSEHVLFEQKTYDDIPTSILEKLNTHFEKKFKYSAELSCCEQSLIEHIKKGSSPWCLKELQEHKKKLNSVKTKLSDFEVLHWHEHTQKTNIAGLIASYLRRHYHPELCTQAWCKFHEIVNSYGIVTENEQSLCSLHLCEAPGAFITSLNHYVKSKSKCQPKAQVLKVLIAGSEGVIALTINTIRHTRWSIVLIPCT